MYLCAICNSKRFDSFIFELCTMIVHTFKMCIGHADAGPEQSLVLSLFLRDPFFFPDYLEVATAVVVSVWSF